MGTTGTGKLGGYSGGGGTERKCDKAFSAELEDVARCDYYSHHNAPPPKGTEVVVVSDRRMAVATRAGETVGYLPIEFNYLAKCMQKGFEYEGVVLTSSAKPVPQVEVDVQPKSK